MKLITSGNKLNLVMPDESDKHIFLPDTITELDSDAFKLCTSVYTIHLSQGIRHIPDSCFEDLHVMEVTLPSGLLSIGKRAFANTWINHIVLPDSIRTIRDEAFFNSLLFEIRWPASLRSLGKCVIRKCGNLKKVEAAPELLKKKVFYPLYSYYQGLETFTIPDGVTKISASAFQGCSRLRHITIPDSVTQIGKYAFAECAALQELVLPEGLTEIDSKAFVDCPSLSRITLSRQAFLGFGLVNPDDISASTTVIPVKKSMLNKAGSPFFACSSLQKINLYKDQTLIDEAKWKKAEDKAKGIWEDASFVYQNKEHGTVLVKCKKKTARQLTIPNFVTKIEHDAFDSCTSVKKLILEEGITRITPDVFSSVEINEITFPCSLTQLDGSGFFGFIYYLDGYPQYFPYIDIPYNHPRFASACNNYLFLEKTDQGLRTMFYLPFNYRTDKVIIDEGTVIIGKGTFENIELESLTLPSSLRQIEGDAFVAASIKKLIIQNGCKTLDTGWGNNLELMALTIPRSVEFIGPRLSFFSPYFKSFYCHRNSYAEQWCKEYASDLPIHYLKDPVPEKTAPDPSVRKPAEPANPGSLFMMSENRVVEYLGKKQTVLDMNRLLGSKTTFSFSVALFMNHRELVEVRLPDGMKDLPDRFFSGCINLTAVHLPSGMDSLGNAAFEKCTSLSELSIPEHVSRIPEDLFGRTFPAGRNRKSIQIYGVPGSAAEQFVRNFGCTFIDIRESPPASELKQRFEWKQTGSTIAITNILDPEDSTPLTIPDKIENRPVTAILYTGKLGHRKLIIGKYLLRIDASLVNLSDISVSPENTEFLVEDGLFYMDKGTTLSLVLPSTANNHTLKVRNGTHKIAPHVFDFCVNLRELQLPASITSIDSNAGLKGRYWDDPLIICGYPGTAALGMAQKVGCVYVDLSLPKEEQLLSRTFKMLPNSISYNRGKKTPFGYVSYGYSGTDTDVRIPSKIGETDVKILSCWSTQTIPKTVYIPASISNIFNDTYNLATDRIEVDPDNHDFTSADGQLYDSNQRLLYCPPNCNGTPALPDVKILCDDSFRRQTRQELIIDKPLRILGNIFTEGHLDRLIIKAPVSRVVLSPGEIDTVVIPESLTKCAPLFYNVRFISIVGADDSDHPGKEICRLAGAALEHAVNISDNPARLLDGRPYSQYLVGKIPLDVPWLIRRHDEAFDEIKGDIKIYMAMLRLLNPYLLDAENEAHFRRHLQRSIRRCLELLLDADDYELFRSLCKAGFIHKNNVKKLIELTTNRNKTEWTALLLQSAHQ